MLRNLRKKSNEPKALIGVGVLLVVLGIGAYLLLHNNTSSKTPPAPTGVKLAPATQQEKKESDQNKDQIVEQGQQTSQSQTSTATKTVNIIITDASAIRVGAYVTGVFEEGGVCTATFSQGSTIISRTSKGFGNVSYTQCAPITPDLPNSDLWSVVVSYSSSNAEGKSQPQTFRGTM